MLCFDEVHKTSPRPALCNTRPFRTVLERTAVTATDDFRQLGQDLLAFARNPEAALGEAGLEMFEPFLLTDTPCVQDQVLTPQWVVTRTRYMDSATSTEYMWRKRKEYSSVRHLEHTLRVASDAGGWICGFVLGHAISSDLIYEVSYDASHDRIRGIMYSQRRVQPAIHGEWSVLAEPPLLLEEALRCIPSMMTQSVQRGELASV